MKTAGCARNHLVGGLCVGLLAFLGAVYLGSGARTAVLDAAARNVAARMSAVLGPDTADGDPQAIAHRLVTSRPAGPTFVTVRGPKHQLVASVGAWSGGPGGLVPRAIAQTWRAWLYRTLCAETHRSFADGASMHIGIAWWRVLASAGIGFWSMLLVMVWGFVVAARERRGQSRSGAVSARPTSAWRDWLTRGRAVFGRSQKLRVESAGSKSAGFQPIGRHPMRHAIDEPAPTLRETCPVAPAVAPEPCQSVAEPVAADPQSPADTGRSESGQPASPLDPLVLRFQPIWRGAVDGLLAGGLVRLTHVDDTAARGMTFEELLASDARSTGESRALAQCLVRRLATLQANWRTLELPRVPLMLSLPETLFESESAGDAWAEALSSREPDAGDLVLCVARLFEVGPAAASVRWAVADPPGHDGARWYRLEPDAEPTATAGDNDALRFVLPSAAAESAESAQRPLSPRAFARLMSRSELAPL